MKYGKRQLVPRRHLYKYRAFDDPYDSLRRMLAQNDWWFGSRSSFDDKDDFVFPGVKAHPSLAGFDYERIKIEMQETLDRTGVFCLSESPKVFRLWDLYAGSGAGLCAEIEADYVTDPEFGPFRVTYSDRPKPQWEYTAGEQKRERLTAAALLQKSTQWKYQAEWRCVRTWLRNESPTANRYYPIAARALVGVIFGWKTSETQHREVIQWIENGLRWRRTIRLRQAYLVGEKIQISDHLCD